MEQTTPECPPKKIAGDDELISYVKRKLVTISIAGRNGPETRKAFDIIPGSISVSGHVDGEPLPLLIARHLKAMVLSQRSEK